MNGEIIIMFIIEINLTTWRYTFFSNSGFFIITFKFIVLNYKLISYSLNARHRGFDYSIWLGHTPFSSLFTNIILECGRRMRISNLHLHIHNHGAPGHVDGEGGP